MRIGTFFSGIMGFEVAAMQLGWSTTFTCENDDFRRSFIDYISPNSYNHDDINTFPFDRFKDTDIICGGDPCQPHSVAGNRIGQADPRYLWPKMFEGIETIRPDWVINENVVGTVSNMVLDQKIDDLESIGYSCQPFNIPAAALNADHKRERVFLVAHSNGKGSKTVCSNQTDSRKVQVSEIEARYEKDCFVFHGLHDLLPVTEKEFDKGMDKPSLAISKDGLPYQVDKRFLEAAGNLVCPGIAYIFFSYINEIEKHG